MKLAIVVQRYGLEVNGGAELYARWLAEHLSKHCQVEVITTTALDYFTWEPHYPDGKDDVNGITVHRFDADSPRNMLFFDWLSKFIFHAFHPEFLEKIWMKAQGPYSSSMYEFIGKSEDKYDFFIFVTYLYAHAFFGLPMVKNKAILIPTAHDEPPLNLCIFKDFFLMPQGIIFNTIEEKILVNQRFGTENIPQILTGIGVDLPEKMDVDIASRHPELKDKDYILFVGRISTSKGTDILVNYFLRFKNDTGRDILLVMLGKDDMKLGKNSSIILPGFVSEEEKFMFLKNAKALANPSRFESLSIVLLESWTMETPVLVNEACEVTRKQTERSKGGLTFHNYESFEENLSKILDDRQLAENMGKSGRNYTEENYSWERIEKLVMDFLRGLIR